MNKRLITIKRLTRSKVRWFFIKTFTTTIYMKRYTAKRCLKELILTTLNDPQVGCSIE